VNDPSTGHPSTLAGLFLGWDGSLHPIPNSMHGLSAPNARPSQVSFTPDGTRLVVSERETNAISVFRMNMNGTLQNPMVTPSPRPAPFGFDFAGFHRLVVSEAAPMDPAGSSASSYDLMSGGLSVISPGILNGQMASCWTTIYRNRAYVSNMASNTVTTYGIAADGTLTVRQAAVPTAGEGSAPIDAGISDNGRMFFQLLGGKGTIAVYRTNAVGDLTLVAVRNPGLPMLGTQGLAVLDYVGPMNGTHCLTWQWANQDLPEQATLNEVEERGGTRGNRIPATNDSPPSLKELGLLTQPSWPSLNFGRSDLTGHTRPINSPFGGSRLSYPRTPPNAPQFPRGMPSRLFQTIRARHESLGRAIGRGAGIWQR
jgi:hypothetical protein